MNKYQALIRYEFKSLRWMCLYFALGCLGLLGFFGTIMEEKRRAFLTHIGVWQIKNQFTQEMNWFYIMVLAMMSIGLILMVYLQFRDAKNIEVGRFLKALPIKSTQLYWVRVGCGIFTYTVPFLLYAAGILALRSYHNSWLKDYYSISMWEDALLQAESPIRIVGLLGILYLIVTAVYVVLLLMQYLISNRIFAIIVAAIALLIPTYIAAIINEWMNIDAFLICPFAFGLFDSSIGESAQNGEMANISYIDQVGFKLFILFLIIGLAIGLGWMNSRRFKIENQNKLIPSQVSRSIFIIVGTVCTSLLPSEYVVFILGGFNQVSLGILLGSSLLLGGIGFVIFYKISLIGCRGKDEVRK